MASLSEETFPPSDDLKPFDLAQLEGGVAVITGAASGARSRLLHRTRCCIAHRMRSPAPSVLTVPCTP
jgi:hypothetical protein